MDWLICDRVFKLYGLNATHSYFKLSAYSPINFYNINTAAVYPKTPNFKWNYANKVQGNLQKLLPPPQ